MIKKKKNQSKRTRIDDGGEKLERSGADGSWSILGKPFF